MKRLACLLLLSLAFSATSYAQGFEVNGGYLHVTGDQGLDGFTIGAAYRFGKTAALAFNYDGVWDTSTIGAFELTNVGLTVSKSHLQNWMVGPRIFLPGLFRGKGTIKGHTLQPFAEVQFGESHLHSQLSATNLATIESSDSAFSWLLGGGGDFALSDHWSARITADFLRTHFADSGQSRLRFGMGVAYNFRGNNSRSGGTTPPPPKASCSATPLELLPWDGPVTVSLRTEDFNPKNTLTYAWNSSSGNVNGQGRSVTVETASLAAGKYTVSAIATDPDENGKTASCSASFTVKEPKPPVLECSATPSTVHPGDPVTINVQGNSPDLSRIKERKFSTSAGAMREGETTAGNQPGQFKATASLDTAGVQPGPINITISVTDVHELSATCVATANVEAP